MQAVLNLGVETRQKLFTKTLWSRTVDRAVPSTSDRTMRQFIGLLPQLSGNRQTGNPGWSQNVRLIRLFAQAPNRN